MRGAFVAALLLLSGCAFESERPLFAESASERVFGDGQTLQWRERPDGETFDVRFERVGATYVMSRVDQPNDRVPLIVVAIPGTPEDDYVAQLRLGERGDGAVYAFLWRTEDGFRVFSSPTGVDESREPPSDAARFCRSAAYGECGFASRENVLGYYRAIVYPRFVRGSGRPSSYLDLLEPRAQETPTK